MTFICNEELLSTCIVSLYGSRYETQCQIRPTKLPSKVFHRTLQLALLRVNLSHKAPSVTSLTPNFREPVTDQSVKVATISGSRGISLSTIFRGHFSSSWSAGILRACTFHFVWRSRRWIREHLSAVSTAVFSHVCCTIS